MKTTKQRSFRFNSVYALLQTAVFTLVILASAIWMFIPQNANAAALTPRKLTLSNSASNARNVHTFNFTTASTANIGSISFEYCTTASGACSAPSGFDSEEGTLAIGTQVGATGFTVHANTTTNNILITRSATSLPASTAVTIPFGTGAGTSNGPENPTANNTTFFTRITTYTSTDGTTGATDTGVTAASTAQAISLTGVVAETLTFCTGTSITGTNCGSVAGSTIDFGSFSSSTASTGTSVMAASTNGDSGYGITVNGATLTSGGDTITALTSPTASSAGSEQFGLNLMDNTTPNVGADVNPTPNGTTLRGQPSTDYDTADVFKFVTGNQVAASDNGGAGSTNAQTFTVSYLVNIGGATEAGTYTATMTYICTATF